jgi:RsiW-degrading membrane proteinase PrsW (M82 family)
MTTHTSPTAAVTPASAADDRRLAVVAGTGIAISVAAGAARLLHLLPAGGAAAIVLVGVAVGLRVALIYVSRSASSAARARIVTMVSTVGLALSAVAVLALLPHLTKHGGFSKFSADTFGQLWALAVLTIVAGPARTIGWRGLVGAGLAGFLAVTALARVVGRPIVNHFGVTSLPAVAGLVPLTEELFKLLPVVLVVLIAVRRTRARPSALDLVLLGAWSGAGFALSEDASYGRGGAEFSSFTPLSWLLPSGTHATVYGSGYYSAGHLIHSALIALGIGVAVLYRHRMRFARAWLVIAVAVSLGEHALANAISAGGLTHAQADPYLALTFRGHLSFVLLLIGSVFLAMREGRITGNRRPTIGWLRLQPDDAARRAGLLAAAQGQQS